MIIKALHAPSGLNLALGVVLQFTVYCILDFMKHVMQTVRLL